MSKKNSGKILAFDTSTKMLSVACLEKGEVKACFHEDVGIGHSTLLIPTIGETLRRAGWDKKDIGTLCVGLGPGSFTGLRIGVSAAKGLAAVLGCGVIGVPTMDAIARNAGTSDGYIAPFLDARKGKVYCCIYKKCGDRVERVSDYMLVDAGSLLSGLKEKVFFFGDGVDKYKDELDACSLAEYDWETDWYPSATYVGQIGRERGDIINAEELEPMYLHAKECSITRKQHSG